MKKILITGKESYIGSNFKKYLEQYPNDYYVEELDVKDDSWKSFDFSKYDVVYHVAGIAHIKEKKENKELYFKINRDLAIEVAKKSKKEKVKQFIFMSSMSVYGLEYSKEIIGMKTSVNPISNYGKSKLEAENEINQLSSDFFKVAILRPPMVYGDDSPGNLTKLFKAVSKIRIFPKFKNERSSITVDNLCKAVLEIIKNKESGTFLSQNDNYMCTYEIVREHMNKENRKVIFTPVFNPIIKLSIGKIGVITKCFGDLKYDK